MVIIKGRLGSPPQPRSSAEGGASMCSFVVGTGEAWTERNGKPQARTTWIKVVCWGKIADWAAQYLQKGSQVFLVGKITERKWQGEAGEGKSAMEIQADRIEAA